ncbi:DNA cytosine methyltransferase [Pseudoduganella violaceinigra]|uniref:DNA cytosine methyltransferase n=1 Tax=Pseudoduganella violaceinigra TaxID=246602 RepID=UPI000424C333|nr:DNA cytosine methyltransferase [Pseudoduganella violaceinigra]
MPKDRDLDTQSSFPSAGQLPNWENFVRLKAHPEWQQTGKKVRIVDLFCGCGGLSLGATLAGAMVARPVEIALAADNWDEALQVYGANFSPDSHKTLHQDLAALVESPGSVVLSKQGKALAKTLGRVDLLVAGPPCQGNSDLNNASRRDDPRNQLYTVPVAMALSLKVEFLVVENVPPVVHSSGKVVFDAVSALTLAGYSVLDFVANAADFGLPQARRRHILVASRKHNQAELEQALTFSKPATTASIWSFISDLEMEKPASLGLLSRPTKMSKDNIERINYLFDNNLFDLPNQLRPACHRDKVHSYVSMYGRLRKDAPSQTITSGFGSMGQGRYVHPTQRRMISAHEAARIQGFPDYFSFSNVRNITSLRTMIANAVPPGLIALILARLLAKSDSK